MHSWLKQFHYKELFLVGFYLSFIVITSIAFVIDLVIDNHFDAVLDAVFVGIGIAFLRYFLRGRNHKIAARAIFWIAAMLVFIFVGHSAFDMSVMFTLLLPVVGFILMPPREIVLNISLYYLALGGLFAYGYGVYDDHPLLHSAQTMSAYFIASLFVIAFGLFYNFAIEESHRQLESANRQKEILLKEIHHRIKNNLNIVSSILGLQQLESGHPEIDRIVEQNRLRIESISLAHEVLYRSEDLEHIDFATYVRQLVEQILITCAKEESVELHLDVVPAQFDLETMIRLGIIINELVTNSVKYAFGPEGGELYLSLTCEAGRCRLRYRDSGGVEDEAPPHDTLGLSLIQLTVEQMHGMLSMHEPAAYHYRMEFDA